VARLRTGSAALENYGAVNQTGKLGGDSESFHLEKAAAKPA
jgi:hypothetical protein